MKLEIKGTITHTSQPEAIGKQGNLFKLEIVVSKPAPVNEFGEVNGQPQHYIIQILKNSKEELPNPATLLNRKVSTTCYLNGFDYPTDKGIQYGLRLKLKDLTIIQ